MSDHDHGEPPASRCRIIPGATALPDTVYVSGRGPRKIAGVIVDGDRAVVDESLHLVGWAEDDGPLVTTLRAATDAVRSRAADAAAPPRHVAEPAIFGGCLWPHFGHFFAETLPWMASLPDDRVTGDDGPEADVLRTAPIHVFRQWPKHTDAAALCRDERGFIHQALRGLGIAPARVVVIDRPTRFDRLIVPLAAGGGAFNHAFWTRRRGWDTRAALAAFLHRFRPPGGVPPRPPGGGASVYVSRSRLPMAKGRQLGERLLETLLAKRGFTIFHPQEHPLDEQVRLYASARRVVFAEGSAVYPIALLAPESLPDEVVCVLRRRGGEGLLAGIAASFPARSATFRCIDALRADGLCFPRACDSLSVIDVGKVLRELGLADDAAADPDSPLARSLLRGELVELTAEQRMDLPADLLEDA